MADHSRRPKRVLAAWGYESGTKGDRIEVDVWTVNEPKEPEEPPCRERARNAFDGHVERIIACYGNVARVEYSGAAGEGYRYIDTNSKASQQAFAGAKRHAGGTPDPETGRMTEGYDPPKGEPDIERAITHGESEVIPPLERQSNGQLANRIGREPSRDEEGEPVETRPFDGFANVIRFFTGGGTERYHVENGTVKNGTGIHGKP